jgi:predicted TIM-barrel fold metal-dependent hydrolase
MGIFLYPDELKQVLKQWLELFPDKIVFGSDAFPLGDSMGAEENYWLAVQSARTALAAALAEMVTTRKITEEKAMKLARAYLHDTASKIYATGR